MDAKGNRGECDEMERCDHVRVREEDDHLHPPLEVRPARFGCEADLAVLRE